MMRGIVLPSSICACVCPNASISFLITSRCHHNIITRAPYLECLCLAPLCRLWDLAPGHCDLDSGSGNCVLSSQFSASINKLAFSNYILIQLSNL